MALPLRSPRGKAEIFLDSDRYFLGERISFLMRARTDSWQSFTIPILTLELHNVLTQKGEALPPLRT